MMDGRYYGMGGGWWILMVVFWIGLLAAIVWAGARLFPRPGSVDRFEGAVALERYGRLDVFVETLGRPVF